MYNNINNNQTPMQQQQNQYQNTAAASWCPRPVRRWTT